MTPADRTLRIGQLRDVLCSVRNAYASLATGDLSAAVRWLDRASSGLGFACGLWHATTVSATATLRRVVAQLEIDVEIAVERPQEAQPADLVPLLFECLKVLRAKGVEVEDELLLDRARNCAAGLSGSFRFTELESVQPIGTVGKSGALPQ